MKNPITAIDDVINQGFKLIPFISILAPAMILLCGFGLFFAVTQVQKAVGSGTQVAAVAMQAKSKPRLDKVKLDIGGYLEATSVFKRLNPAVNVSYVKERDVIRVAIADPVLLPEWLYLLSTVQGFKKGLIWNASTICLKKCDEGAVAAAELKAFTQKIAVD